MPQLSGLLERKGKAKEGKSGARTKAAAKPKAKAAKPKAARKGLSKKKGGLTPVPWNQP